MKTIRKSTQNTTIMRHSIFPVILCLLALIFTGCSREIFYENMYHGMQKSDEMLDPAADPAPVEEKPRYDQYKKDRDEITGRKDPAKQTP